MNNPLVSVLMPVHNDQDFLSHSIDSILNQSYPNFEYIIINDFSTDKSDGIIRKYKNADSRIKYLQNKSHLEISKTLNIGINACKGKYIVRMDADDISHENRIEKQVHFMESNPDIGVCGSQASLFGDRKGSFFLSFYKEHIDLKVVLILGSAIIHPSAIIRSSILKENNIRYNEQRKYAEDAELWYRISKYSKLANLEESLIQYRIHETNRSKIKQKLTQRDMYLLRLEILSELFPDQNIPDISEISNRYTDQLSLNKLIKLYKQIMYANHKAKVYVDESITKVFSKDIFNQLSSNKILKIGDFISYMRSPFLWRGEVKINDWVYRFFKK